MHRRELKTEDWRLKTKEELWCQALSNGHTMRYRALGGSMSPFIRSESILTVNPKERISVGDVILYRNRDGIVAHRVIGKREISGKPFFVTKGDNLRYRDDLVDPSVILGKIMRIEHGEKQIDLNSFRRRLLNQMMAIVSCSFFHGFLLSPKSLRSRE